MRISDWSSDVCSSDLAFEAAPAPDPWAGDWAAWQAILARSEPGSEAAMTVERGAFQTVCSSLLALPAPGLAGPGGTPWRPVWLYAPGRPDRHAYAPVEALADTPGR